MNEGDPSIWKWLVDRMWAPLGVVLAASWAMLNARIVRTEQKADSAVSRDDFKDYVEQDREAHEQLRQSVIKLFDKMDEIKTLIITRK